MLSLFHSGAGQQWCSHREGFTAFKPVSSETISFFPPLYYSTVKWFRGLNWLINIYSGFGLGFILHWFYYALTWNLLFMNWDKRASAFSKKRGRTVQHLKDRNSKTVLASFPKLRIKDKTVVKLHAKFKNSQPVSLLSTKRCFLLRVKAVD